MFLMWRIMLRCASRQSWYLLKRKEQCLLLVKAPRVPTSVHMLWQEKACHLLGTDGAKQSGSLFLVFGQRVEMNQRTVSHSTTVRSPEISDVSLLPAALLCSTHSTSHFNQFFSPSLSLSGCTFDSGLRGCVSWHGQRNQLAPSQIPCGLFLRYTSGV